MKNLTIALLLILCLASCKKDDPVAPSANFTYTVAGTFSPCKVEFAAAADAENCQWTINHTTVISGGKSLIYAFDTPGTYPVKLSVTENGVTGETTQQVVIPEPATRVKINSLTLTSYPLTKNGEKWDLYPVSGPDISFQVYGPAPAKPLLYLHPTAFEDTELVQPLQFSLPAEALLPFQHDAYHLLVVDNDNAGYADIMGEVTLNLWDTISATKTYPSSFTFTQNGITAVLDVTWQ